MSDRYAYLPQSENVDDRRGQTDYASQILALLGMRYTPLETMKRAGRGLIRHPFSQPPIEGFLNPPQVNPLGEQAGVNDVLRQR